MLGLHEGSVVSADTLVELLWGEDPPRTAGKALQTHISSLRRSLGDGFVLTQGAGWILAASDVDASRYKAAARSGRDAVAVGDVSHALGSFEEALTLWRGMPELPDSRRGTSEKTRWMEGHAALVEDRADALLATGRAAEVVGDLEAAVADAPLRERRWGQLMLALYRAGRQGEALSAYRRARSLLADELGVDPGPELRRLEAAIVAQDAALETPVLQQVSAVTRAVTFLLTDIEGSTAAWEADADAMGLALARHDELVEQVVTSRGGRLIKTRGEGDATFSVFDRPSGAAAAAIELQDAIAHEPWALRQPMRIRVALHTGEVELRDGDYFGRAVNRAARLRSVAEGGQILCSGATAELVIDSLSDDVVLTDLGMRQLKNLARPEHVFELRLESADERREDVIPDEPIKRPSLPTVLAGPGPFVGRGRERGQLFSAWQTTLAGGTNAALIAGEPGVGKTRLAGEWSRQAYDQGALVIYGRCDEDLGAPYQPFAEALRSLVPCLSANRLRGLRGVEALLALVPGLTDVLPDLAAPTRADPDTERFALFDAVVALLGLASAGAPVVLILDDLHWAAKPTLLLLRHLLRFGEHARVQIVGTYRSTDLDRSHPLAAMLADLHRSAVSGTANRIQLSGLDENDVSTYVAEAGYDDEELARALASVTGGNPFFLIEALRHVDESGGHWDPSTLPQGVREAVSRRLSRLTPETNKALGAAAVVGSRFAIELVERVVGDDLVDAFDEACKAGIVIEEHGGNYRFNHALVRQSLLAELASVRRMRLHQRIAATLETQPGADDELLAELAYHYFECAWAGNAAKAVDYCRRAADQAMARLGYEGAADLYDRALHALEEIDDELSDRNEQVAALLVARCEALLAAGDVATAARAVAQLQDATADSARLAAWATCFDGELSMLVRPEDLDETEAALRIAADKLAELDDAAGEAKAHTVRAACLARLGRIGDCEIALDDALTAARRAGEYRRVNAVLAGAPLAALWGPNPVPRAGGRCLDVVRLLRITTDSPAVEATSTRCQAVLEAFRGRAEAARRMIDSARRTVTELGLRHALLEVEQFAGIVELVIDDSGAAESRLRQAYNGFRRMGLDADTAETAALLGRACVALDRDAEADELCTESERLAGHALKPSIAWRTLRATLLSRQGDHDEARRVAEAAVALAERTDALVDHGDACLALATVFGSAGDVGGLRAAAERAVDLYERKGAAALAEKARGILGERDQPIVPTPPEAPVIETHTAAVQTSERVMAAVNREDWDEFERLFAPEGSVESRRKLVGFKKGDFRAAEVIHQTRRDLETGTMRLSHIVIAVRGERLALARATLGTADVSPGAPQDEFLQLYGVDMEGRISFQVWFDVNDMDAALAELDATHARFEEEAHRQTRKLENAASRMYERMQACFRTRDWAALGDTLVDDFHNEDRRRVVNAGVQRGRNGAIETMRWAADLGITHATSNVIATRGEHLLLAHARFSQGDEKPETFHADTLQIAEVDADEHIAAIIMFDPDDFGAAIAELDARYLAGEAAAHARTWSVISGSYAAINRHERPATSSDWINVEHRREVAMGPDDLFAYIGAGTDRNQDNNTCVETVHRLEDVGAVVTYAAHETSQEGFAAEWRGVALITVKAGLINRSEIFDEADLDAAITRFGQLSRPAPHLENAASQVYGHLNTYFAARDWAAITELLADDVSTDDRRRVVNSGLRRGRDAVIAEISAFAAIGVTTFTTDFIATRGDRLVLVHSRTSSRDGRPEAFHNEVLHIVELDACDRIATVLAFDLDDFDSAIVELDDRYLAGEAAAHAHTWSLITTAYAALNNLEHPATTPDWVNVDHRHGPAFARGDMTAYIGAVLDGTPDLSNYIEAVHRLSNLGAVVTHAAQGTSQEGFDAEWRVIDVLTFEGDLISRLELFDEADIDAALARFDELSRPAPRLQNAASRVYNRLNTYFATRDWAATSKAMAPNMIDDDRRRMVNAGIRRGRDAEIANIQATAELADSITSTVIATRGERLALCRTCIFGRGQESEAFRLEFLSVVEINVDEQLAAHVGLELDDFEAAIAELDARFLAGEAAAHAQTWSVITAAFAALNRHEPFATTPDWIHIDHRPLAMFEARDLPAYLRATFEVTPDINMYIEAVHQLTDVGTVLTHAAYGSSQEGFDAEWRMVLCLTVENNVINRGEIFAEADLDAATARFDERSRPALKNAASQAYERICECLETRDWNAVAELSAENVSVDDRRRVVNAGIRTGRDAAIEDLRVAAEIGFTYKMLSVTATRGDRLALMRVRAVGRDPEAIADEVPNIVEIDSDGRIAAAVVFDLDDIDAAFAELDARYVAGEAAPYSHTWSVITQAYARFSRHDLSPMTPNFVFIDHRPVVTVEGGDLEASIHAVWELTPDIKISVEAVHRLSAHGAVVTHILKGLSKNGFETEWRLIHILIVEGELLSRCEAFDESDLDTALARFEELQPQTRRLENEASQAESRFGTYYAARDWDALADLITDDFSMDDRRRMINAGVRHGRDAEIASQRMMAELGVSSMTQTVIAMRGRRLALGRYFVLNSWGETGVLCVSEINAENRIVARAVFDPEDLDAAFEELDVRYLAGEAAAFANTWSVIAREIAAFNRREHAVTTPDPVYIDHRPLVSIEGVDLPAVQRAVWDLTPDARTFIEAVHRLSELGAVVSQVVKGTSSEGFDAEWQMISIFTVEGDLGSGYEVFEEADLDDALARFDELQTQVSRLENAASQVYERLSAHNVARNWAAVSEILADDIFNDDRRRVVNAGVLHGRDATMASMQATAAFGLLSITPSVIATRGERLSLTREHWLVGDRQSEEYSAEVLGIIEIDSDERVVARLVFDPDDLDAAFEELDARYIAGEAASDAHTWSVILQACAALNRREIFATTADFVDIDHRSLAAIGSGDLKAYMRAALNDGAYNVYIEAVHRLSHLGAVVTLVSTGTSQEGFDGEWRMAVIFMVEGDLINRCEILDEADLDAALARFDELQPQTTRPENAASRVAQRCWSCLASRDWDAIAEMLADNYYSEDRRRVVGYGIRHGRDIHIDDLRTMVDVGFTNVTSAVIAARGEHLVLTRVRGAGPDPEAFYADVLQLVEIGPDELVTAAIVFDPDDFDTALSELEARYLAGEAADCAHTWSVIMQAYAAANRREIAATSPKLVNIDHRRLAMIESGGLIPYLRDTFDDLTDITTYLEAVHRLTGIGAVVTHVGTGTSKQGFHAEWRMISVIIVEDSVISRCEMFDEADLDTALARFDELHSQARKLENAASQAVEREWACFATRDWAAMADTMTDNFSTFDHRRVVNAGVLRGRDAHVANYRAVAEVGFEGIASTVIATRGQRLVLIRVWSSVRGYEPGETSTEMIGIVEVDADNRLTAAELFDLEDIDAAFEALDARYLAGEAAVHSHTWALVMRAYEALNRRQLPETTVDWVNIDHRRLAPIAAGDLGAYLLATWDLSPQSSIRIEAVHRLSEIGAVVTHVVEGTSQQGFDAEWRTIDLATYDGDLISRSELFDEADLDAALARFDELSPQPQRLQNAASRAHARLRACVAARDWSAASEILAYDIAIDDRRRVVNSGVQNGRDAAIADIRGAIDSGLTNISLTVTATRGDRLALSRMCISGQDQLEAFRLEFLAVVEINADEQIVARVAFDLEDIDAAFAELDARYLAGEAAPYARTWSVMTRTCAAFNRGELPATTPDSVFVDHRPILAVDAVDLPSYLRVMWDLTPDIRVNIEAVHRLSELGAVLTHAVNETSPEGFNAEWGGILIYTLEADMVNRCEVFDEADFDAALARFDELDRSAS